MGTHSRKISFIIALCLHILLAFLLLMSLEKTIVIPAQPVSAPNEEIIDAVMVNTQALKSEIDRLNALEAKKRADELARQKELANREKESKLKRQQEEMLALTLKKQNEELKKQAELQLQEKQRVEQERQQKLNVEKEELRKIQKEKEKALLETQKAQEEVRQVAQMKQAQLRKQQESEKQQANVRAKQDEITRYATLMRNKIHQNWRQPIGLDIIGFKCKVAVKLLPTGEVIEAMVVESSGSVEFDRSTELAIRKASPLPMPSDLDTAKEFRQFTFTFHPEAA